ncbi:hypothetical protein EDB81DRAFT_254807 [Dactylonectria macrodidyma]|uniref:Uncharacterized protein n=1 Tax=Dactylonectria macrodidyma TaxID=307937 RepID=A0A9P9FLP3_9HYPO|nr:hypothetical protein EDB81DRAFT_254807 [Dactylonectria macrodidyma]
MHSSWCSELVLARTLATSPSTSEGTCKPPAALFRRIPNVMAGYEDETRRQSDGKGFTYCLLYALGPRQTGPTNGLRQQYMDKIKTASIIGCSWVCERFFSTMSRCWAAVFACTPPAWLVFFFLTPTSSTPSNSARPMLCVLSRHAPGARSHDLGHAAVLEATSSISLAALDCLLYL